jgi:hypothetical protein
MSVESGSGFNKAGSLAARLRRMKENGASGTETPRKTAGNAPPAPHASKPPCAKENGASAGEPTRSKPAGETPPVGWKAISEYAWTRKTDLPAACPRHLHPSPLLPSGGTMSDFIFYDVETTGLSGGAGTLAFLIGLGSCDGEKLTIEQFFLLDYPGEREFLDIVLSRMDPEKTLVSYNGKAFDTQILRTRCILNGRRLMLANQLDLLYCARRLYRDTLPSCRLETVEKQVLGVQREADIPGALIPEVYFDYLATGRTDELERVFSHHLQDIASLERLLAHFTRVLEHPATDAYADRCRLGRWFVEAGFGGGLDLLKRAFEAGDGMAGYHLAKYLKRQGDFERAAEIWQSLYKGKADLQAAFELSKYAEHKVRDYDSAESLTLAIIEALQASAGLRAPEPIEALRHRLLRIRRKKSGGTFLARGECEPFCKLYPL